MFKKIACFGLIALAAVSSVACGAATVSVRDGHYAVNGVTFDPNSSINAAAHAAVAYKNAETYQEAVRNGQAYPYPGGAYRNDFGFFFGGVGPSQRTVPPVPSAPAPAPASAATVDTSDQSGQQPATRADVAVVLRVADRADKNADASVETLRRLRESGVGN